MTWDMDLKARNQAKSQENRSIKFPCPCSAKATVTHTNTFVLSEIHMLMQVCLLPWDRSR